ncbi:MAG TPA: DUF397 domain-containing protein [Rugosimonospora sp.]|nr:DUF397 domain-containing protein [Rugosimonospora sp.]
MIDPAAGWRKSTKSSQGACVEVAVFEQQVRVRDSKNREKGILEFSPDAWVAFVAGVQNDEFDLFGH